jgi:hypothetical protein
MKTKTQKNDAALQAIAGDANWKRLAGRTPYHQRRQT